MSVSDWVYGGATLAFAGYVVYLLRPPFPWGLYRLMQRSAKPDREIVRRAAEAHGPDTSAGELRGAADLFGGGGWLDDAAVFDARAVDMERRNANMDIDSFDGDFD